MEKNFSKFDELGIRVPSSLSLSLSRVLVHKNEFEGKLRVYMILRVKGQNFTVKVNGFQFNLVFYVHLNTHQGVKYFLNFIYTQNKHNLS